ncbi:hypothetical protein [uncultured Pantoea sp.]|uniref:hypothetical protein n=1 Tax=uncultured Pantoea sp. TaxID=218084 RepID=UPI0025F24442|nr:hypothetical protein [uncultured Pantoea sp.]
MLAALNILALKRGQLFKLAQRLAYRCALIKTEKLTSSLYLLVKAVILPIFYLACLGCYYSAAAEDCCRHPCDLDQFSAFFAKLYIKKIVVQMSFFILF